MSEYTAERLNEAICMENDLLIELNELEKITGNHYVLERTCRLVGKPTFDNTRGLKFMNCSECGASIRGYVKEQWTDNEHYEFEKFCNECGAKVVDE